jgi:hypothetical protein
MFLGVSSCFYFAEPVNQTVSNEVVQSPNTEKGFKLQQDVEFCAENEKSIFCERSK